MINSSVQNSISNSIIPNCPELSENKLERFIRLVICGLMAVFMLVLTIVSLLRTTGMEIPEHAVILADSLIENLLFLFIGLILCWSVFKLTEGLSLKSEIVFIAVWTLILGVSWILCSGSKPTFDSQHITDAALEFAHGDYSALSKNHYFHQYSFQLGYVFFYEILIRIIEIFTEVKTPFFVEILNVVFLSAIYIAIVLINDMIFDDKRVRNMTVLFLALAFQPIISCTFTYGILPGLFFAIWAVYFEIRWLKYDRFRFALLSAVLIAIAVLIKPNYIIFYIAMAVIVFVKMFCRKKYLKDICYIVLSAVLVFALFSVVKSTYESRADIEIGDSIPYVSWISMGLNDTSAFGPGWYDSTYTVKLFEDNNYNVQATSHASVENIRQRVSYFIDNPKYAARFFYQKFASQWNETTYQSIWNNKVRDQYYEKTGIAKWACDEASGQPVVEKFMDVYSQLVFFCALLGIFFCFRKKDILLTFFPLIILGGIIYHLLSEAKSQYAIPYFILMSGFAANGLVSMYYFVMEKRHHTA